MNDSVSVEHGGAKEGLEDGTTTVRAASRVPANFKELLIVEDSELADGVCEVLDSRGIPFLVRSMAPLISGSPMTDDSSVNPASSDGGGASSQADPSAPASKIRFGISVPTEFLQRASVCAWQVRAEKKSIQSQRREGGCAFESNLGSNSTVGLPNCGSVLESSAVRPGSSNKASASGPRLWLSRGAQAATSEPDSIAAIPSALWGRESSEVGVLRQSEVGATPKMTTRPLRSGVLANAWLMTSRG